MKLFPFAKLLLLGLVLTLAASGCKKNPGYVTKIPSGGSRTRPADPNDGRALVGGGDTTLTKDIGEGIISNDRKSHEDWLPNAEIFQAFTVHFDFDSSVVKANEKANVAAVANSMKDNPACAVRIEGHCDERGTEEYNRSLGDRRALALRAELVLLGVDPTRVDTITYGEDRPADTGHSEAAWAKNRRGEFIQLMPPK